MVSRFCCLLLLSFSFFTEAHSQQAVTYGKYLFDKVPKGADQGSVHSLELNEDSTYIYTYIESDSAGGYRDYGKWFVKDNSLLLTSADSMKIKRLNSLNLRLITSEIFYIDPINRDKIKCNNGSSYFVNENSSVRPSRSWELPDPQRADLRTLETKWMEQEYWTCLKDFKLKMNCSGCGYIYIDVIIHIDEEGKMQHYDIIRENICGNNISTELKKCFMDYFENLIFPASLKGLIIECKLGTGLKC